MIGNGRWTKKLSVAITVATILALLPLQPAFGCSCARLDIEEGTARSDGAFVGIARAQEVKGPERVEYTFEVYELFKGDIGEEVQISTPRTDGMCGLGYLADYTLGVIVNREKDRWVTHLCNITDPQSMWEALGSLPEPDGAGPPEFIVGGAYETERALMLDEGARTIAYAKGRRATSHISICPGGERSVEIAGNFSKRRVIFSIRDLTTFRAVRSLRLPFDRDFYSELPEVEELACRSPNGELAYVQGSDTRNPRHRSVLLRVANGEKQVVYRGNIREGAIGTDYMYILTGYFGRNVGRVHLETGEYVQLARVRTDITGLDVAPDESYISFIYPGDCATENPEHVEVYVVETTDAEPVIRKVEAEPTCGWSDDTEVVDENTFVYVDGASTTMFDKQLNILGHPDFDDWTWAVDSTPEYLYGVNNRSLMRVPLPDGEPEIVRRLPGYASWTIAARD